MLYVDIVCTTLYNSEDETEDMQKYMLLCQLNKLGRRKYCFASANFTFHSEYFIIFLEFTAEHPAQFYESERKGRNESKA